MVKGATAEQVLQWLAKEITHSEREQQDFAKAINSSPATISRVVTGTISPSFKVIYDLLSEIFGEKIFIIENNHLHSQIPIVKNTVYKRLLTEVQEMDPTDIDLLFQFLAVLKKRSLFEPVQFSALIGTLALMFNVVATSMQTQPGLMSVKKDEEENDVNHVN